MTFQTSNNNSFNTQPPEGGWEDYQGAIFVVDVSTHSRLKAAGEPLPLRVMPKPFQHTAA